VNDCVNLSYWTVQPDRFTFRSSKIRGWVESRLEGDVLNACCGPTHLDHDQIHRNDKARQLTIPVDGEEQTVSIDADTYHDVRTLDEVVSKQFDVIVYDPPFTDSQARESYGLTETAGYSETVTEVLDNLLKPGGTVLQLGYTSTQFTAHPQYDTTDVALFNTLGRMDDWIATASQKRSKTRCTDSVDSRTATQSVLPNEAAQGVGGETTSGNGDEAVTISYHQLSESTQLKSAVAEQIAELSAPPVLHIDGGEIPVDLPKYSASLGLSRDVDADHHWDGRALSSEFDDLTFDTVVFAPQREVYQQNIEYEGKTRGRDAALKREFSPLVAPHGRVVQVGRTATNMPGSLPYRREEVHIFAHPSADHDLLVTVDKAGSILSPNGLSSPHQSGVRGSVAEAEDQCYHCGAGEDHGLVYDLTCFSCGAAPGNYCVDQDGNPRQEPHTERLEAADEASHGIGECVPQPAKTVRDHLTASGDNQQTGLELF